MNFVPPAVLERARQIDLYSYLKANEPTELVRCGNGIYCTREHDSLKISNGKWFWWSHGIGGHTALDYLVKVREMRLPDAVALLTGTAERNLPPIRADPRPKEKKLLDVKKNSLCRKVKPYLFHRGLDGEIVEEMIAAGRIAEEDENGFALFYGFDENGIPRQCSARATDGTSVKRDVAGSDKRYCFRLDAECACEQVWIFESAIDLLSFATLMKQSGRDYKEQAFLSLSGVYMPPKDGSRAKVPVALECYLSAHPEVKTVHLCLDHDHAGLLAAEGIAAALGDRVTVRRHLPPSGKDWNEYLQSKTNRIKNESERINKYER